MIFIIFENAQLKKSATHEENANFISNFETLKVLLVYIRIFKKKHKMKNILFCGYLSKHSHTRILLANLLKTKMKIPFKLKSEKLFSDKTVGML